MHSCCSAALLLPGAMRHAPPLMPVSHHTVPSSFAAVQDREVHVPRKLKLANASFALSFIRMYVGWLKMQKLLLLLLLAAAPVDANFAGKFSFTSITYQPIS